MTYAFAKLAQPSDTMAQSFKSQNWLETSRYRPACPKSSNTN